MSGSQYTRVAVVLFSPLGVLCHEGERDGGDGGQGEADAGAEGGWGGALGVAADGRLAGLGGAIGAQLGVVEEGAGDDSHGFALVHVEGDVAGAVGGAGAAAVELDNLVAGVEAADAELVLVALGALVGDAEDDLGAVGTLAQAQVGVLDEELLRGRGGELGVQGLQLVAGVEEGRGQLVQGRGGVVLGLPEGLAVEGGRVALEVLLLALVD